MSEVSLYGGGVGVGTGGGSGLVEHSEDAVTVTES